MIAGALAVALMSLKDKILTLPKCGLIERCESGVGGFDQSPVEPSIAGGVVSKQSFPSFIASKAP